MVDRFIDKMTAAALRNESLLCVGLDPDPSLMPISDVFEFNKAIIDATKDLVCAYKPNVAFYDGLGEEGHDVLMRTIKHIPPDIPIIGDSKRGDVPDTSKFHAKAMFEVWGFDAATVNPYGGRDAVQPFLDYEDKGVFVWCRSSNPGARDIQDLMVVSPEVQNEGPRPLYELIAILAKSWETSENVGLVVGATFPAELEKVRALCPQTPILIPGVGAQSGRLDLAVSYGVDNDGRNAIISVSRSILYASKEPKRFDEAARSVAMEIRNLINGHLSLLGSGWAELVPSN